MNVKEYDNYVKAVTPTTNIFINVFKAFVVGGGICTLGQILGNIYSYYGVNKEDEAIYVSITLVGLSVLFTAFNLYSKLANIAGAGTLVPITGFANSVAAPTIEFKKEGQVFGIGCKVFSIAGPVILYGIVSSWIVGLIYWVLKAFELM